MEQLMKELIERIEALERRLEKNTILALEYANYAYNAYTLPPVFQTYLQNK